MVVGLAPRHLLLDRHFGITSMERAIETKGNHKSSEAYMVCRTVTIAGDHTTRWRQVFKILDEALEPKGNGQRSETVHSVRSGLTRRAS